MIPNDYRPLIERLTKATTSGTVSWSTSAEPDAFLVSLSGYALRIAKFQAALASWGSRPNEEYMVQLLTPDGETIDEFSVPSGGTDFSKLETLWSLAKRRALKIDKAISDILKNLPSE